MYLNKATQEGILNAVQQMAPAKDDVIALFLAENELPLEVPELVAALQQQGHSFFGGVFPGLICPVVHPARLGVRHGWRQLLGPVIATRTSRNTIYELNWRAAFDVYREAVEADSGQRLLPDNFFDIAKGYPFGLLRENQEDIVRDPIAVGAQGELICVGEVPPHSVLNILKGQQQALIEAAEQAVKDGLAQEGSPPAHVLAVDCISRTLFLEEHFNQEREAVQAQLPEGLVLQGVLSLGEISSYGSGMLEFFNKTIVVGLLQ